MSRLLPLVIALLGFALAAASAQEAVEPVATAAAESSPESAEPVKKAETRKGAPPRPVPSAKKRAEKSRRVAFDNTPDESAATPAAEAEERPRSFWQRLFGRRKPRKVEPVISTPIAVTTPKATPRGRKKAVTAASTPAPKAKDSAGSEKPVAAAEESTPKATPAPKPTHSKSSPASTPATASAPAPTPVRKAPVAPAADADAEAQEKYRYEVAKGKALQDPEIQKLKEKADGAISDDEARKAQRAYNKALFGKIRSVDSSVKERADRIEAAILKRLEAGE